MSDPAAGDSSLPRRRAVVAATAVVGVAVLAWGLRAPANSARFWVGTFTLAAVWLIGGRASGPIPLGDRRPLPPLAGGVGLVALFVAGAFIVREIPWLSDEIGRVVGLTRGSNRAGLVATTVVNGVAEEVYFRGALFAALPARWRVAGVIVAYTAATMATGNVMLGFAAALVGALVTVVRTRTGGIAAPVVIHLVWSLAMLVILPQMFG